MIEDIKEIKIENVINEEDFEKQLVQWLKAKNYKVERQVKIGKERKIDLMINNKIPIELKIADKTQNIQNLIGQILIYKKYLKKIVICILDVGVITELKKYINLIKNIDKKNIFIILLKGNIKRIKRKEYLIIEKINN